MHRIERDMHLLAPFGVRMPPPRPRFGWTQSDRTAVRHALDTLPKGGPLVVLNPGTSTWFASKRWLPEYFAVLGDYLVRERDAVVAINLGPGEEELAAEIVDHARETLHVIPSLGSMREVGVLMEAADLVVGADTGPVHLAAVQGTDTVILFGPYDPRYYYPVGHPERALYARLPCSPCRYRTCPTVDCMRLIAPGDVLETCLAVLDGVEPPPRQLTPLKTVPV